jgi:hypothetical protein
VLEFRFGIRVAPLTRGGLRLERMHIYLGATLLVATEQFKRQRGVTFDVVGS